MIISCCSSCSQMSFCIFLPPSLALSLSLTQQLPLDLPAAVSFYAPLWVFSNK